MSQGICWQGRKVFREGRSCTHSLSASDRATLSAPDTKPSRCRTGAPRARSVGGHYRVNSTLGGGPSFSLGCKRLPAFPVHPSD